MSNRALAAKKARDPKDPALSKVLLCAARKGSGLMLNRGVRRPVDRRRGRRELRGRELVLYWRDLAPAQKITVNLDLICRIPGEYRGPASRAYLYYNSDLKHWVDPVAMTIQPREE